MEVIICPLILKTISELYYNFSVALISPVVNQLILDMVGTGLIEVEVIIIIFFYQKMLSHSETGQ